MDKKRLKQINCGYCYFTGSTSVELNEHERIVHCSKTFECDHCSFATNTTANVKKHMPRTHIQIEHVTTKESKEQFECDYCNFQDDSVR